MNIQTGRDILSTDQFPFQKRRLGADIVSEGEYFGLSPEDDDSQKETAKTLPRLGNPSRNDLAQRRKALPPLTAEAEAALILAIQAGDAAAGDKLFLHHESWLRSVAYERWWAVNSNRRNDQRAHFLNDFVSVALLAFWESVLRWKPPYRLNTLVRRAVQGALSDVARDWRNAPGVKIDSRLQRYVRSRPALWDRGHPGFAEAVLELHKKFPKLTASDFNVEMNSAAAIWERNPYSEVARFDDAGDHTGDGEYQAADADQFYDAHGNPGELFGYHGVSEWTRYAANWCRLVSQLEIRNSTARPLTTETPAPYVLNTAAARCRDKRGAASDPKWQARRRHVEPLSDQEQAKISYWSLPAPNKRMRDTSTNPLCSSFNVAAYDIENKPSLGALEVISPAVNTFVSTIPFSSILNLNGTNHAEESKLAHSSNGVRCASRSTDRRQGGPQPQQRAA